MKLAVPPLQQAWDRFWFGDGSARNLAAARIVISLHALWILLARDFPAMSGLPAEFWSRVEPSAEWRYLLFPGHQTLESWLQTGAVAALIAAALGIYPRLSCLLAGLLLYHLAPLETIIWTSSPYERGFEVSVLALITLSAARCGDAWSLSRNRAPEVATAAFEYCWPLTLIQLYVAQIYLFAGYSKLFRAGWHWLSAANMRSWLLVFIQEDQVAVYRSVGQWIADRPSLTLAVAGLALLMDFGFIISVFRKRSRVFIIPLAVLFHVGIFFTMNIAFLNLPQLLVFVDWDRGVAAVRERWRSISLGRFSPLT